MTTDFGQGGICQEFTLPAECQADLQMYLFFGYSQNECSTDPVATKACRDLDDTGTVSCDDGSDQFVPMRYYVQNDITCKPSLNRLPVSAKYDPHYFGFDNNHAEDFFGTSDWDGEEYSVYATRNRNGNITVYKDSANCDGNSCGEWKTKADDWAVGDYIALEYAQLGCNGNYDLCMSSFNDNACANNAQTYSLTCTAGWGTHNVGSDKCVDAIQPANTYYKFELLTETTCGGLHVTEPITMYKITSDQGMGEVCTQITFPVDCGVPSVGMAQSGFADGNCFDAGVAVRCPAYDNEDTYNCDQTTTKDLTDLAYGQYELTCRPSSSSPCSDPDLCLVGYTDAGCSNIKAGMQMNVCSAEWAAEYQNACLFDPSANAYIRVGAYSNSICETADANANEDDSKSSSAVGIIIGVIGGVLCIGICIAVCACLVCKGSPEEDKDQVFE